MGNNVVEDWKVDPNAPEQSLEAKQAWIDNGSDQLDPSRYYDRDFARQEWERLWTRAWLIAAVETELGRPCTDMDRSQKQVAVRRLDEQGAFRLRGAVEEVAARMGVTRATLYTYLNAIRPADSGP